MTTGEHNNNDPHDLSTRLSDAEVVALKARFVADPALGELACRLIAADMAMQRMDVPDSDDAEAVFVHGLFHGSFNEDPKERDEFIRTTSAMWLTALNGAIALPGSEWPEGMVPPEDFLEPLEELEAPVQGGGNV